MKKLKLTKAMVSLLVVTSVFALNPIRASAKWIKSEYAEDVLWKYSEGNKYTIGWKLIDGKWYYFDEYGVMSSGTKIGDYYVNLEGVWTHFDYSANNQKFNSFLDRLYKIEKNDKVANEKANTTYDITIYASDFAKQYDTLLNDIYNYLKKVMPENEFKKLQKEEIEWINKKETAIKDDLQRHEGGTICAYISALDTIPYTHDRIYELLKYIN